MRLLLALAALIIGVLSASADQTSAFCAAAKSRVEGDFRLAGEVAVVFGDVAFKGTGDECLYPLKVLRYASADVLIAQAGEPGKGCHGCGAVLSAYVVQRIGGGLKAVGRYHEFAILGSNGAVEDISPIAIVGDDGIAIESGGTFQGDTSRLVSFYVFHAGQLVNIDPDPIVIAADNSGATTDPGKAVVVTATWFFDPADRSALVVDYKIEAGGASRIERAVWRLQGTSLVLSRGRIPPEISAASGG